MDKIKKQSEARFKPGDTVFIHVNTDKDGEYGHVEQHTISAVRMKITESGLALSLYYVSPGAYKPQNVFATLEEAVKAVLGEMAFRKSSREGRAFWPWSIKEMKEREGSNK